MIFVRCEHDDIWLQLSSLVIGQHTLAIPVTQKLKRWQWRAFVLKSCNVSSPWSFRADGSVTAMVAPVAHLAPKHDGSACSAAKHHNRGGCQYSKLLTHLPNQPSNHSPAYSLSSTHHPVPCARNSHWSGHNQQLPKYCKVCAVSDNWVDGPGTEEQVLLELKIGHKVKSTLNIVPCPHTV